MRPAPDMAAKASTLAWGLSIWSKEKGRWLTPDEVFSIVRKRVVR